MVEMNTLTTASSRRVAGLAGAAGAANRSTSSAQPAAHPVREALHQFIQVSRSGRKAGQQWSKASTGNGRRLFSFRSGLQDACQSPEDSWANAALIPA